MAIKSTAAACAGLAVLVSTALLSAGCQSTFEVGQEAVRPSEQGFVLIPSAKPSAQEYRESEQGRGAAREGGGKTIYDANCANACHGLDGRGEKSTPPNPGVPDLVGFGASLTSPMVYDPNSKDIPLDPVPRQTRLDEQSRQLSELQEGIGEYKGRGKAYRTPLQWYRSVSGDEKDMVNSAGQPIKAHIDAPFNRGAGSLTNQQRWDTVYYLWSLSSDIQMVLDGGRLFQVNCNVCHGRTALGDGPLYHHNMEPQPRNFNNMPWMSDRTNLRLATSIDDGRIYTAMPPWERVLQSAESERWEKITKQAPDPSRDLAKEAEWRIVEYLRTFNYDYPKDFVPKLE